MGEWIHIFLTSALVGGEWSASPLGRFTPGKRTSIIHWIPCTILSHHGMAHPQVADGGNVLHIWRVAANILNKQPPTVDRGWSSSWEVGRGAKNS
jgi:hypothetical protein